MPSKVHQKWIKSAKTDIPGRLIWKVAWRIHCNVISIHLSAQTKRELVQWRKVMLARDWLQGHMMNATGNQRWLRNSSWHVDQGLTWDAHTHTHTRSQSLFNKARQPWRPACLVLYIIVIVHNLVSICYSWDCRESMCVCLRACEIMHVHVCVRYVCVLWLGSTRWKPPERESCVCVEPQTLQRPQLNLNSAVLSLHTLQVKLHEHFQKCWIVFQHDINS